MARAVLLIAALFSAWVYFWRPGEVPPYLDYDSASLGIFVNNVSFHDDYAYGFRGSPEEQDAYRADWAAHFLPASLALSALQRAFSVPPEAVGDLLQVVALVLAALGTGFVVAVGTGRGRATADEGIFLAGFLTAMPPFLLVLRTTQPHFLFSFAMFWLAVLCIDRYLESGSGRALAGLAIAMALYLLVPYVPLVVLPLTGLALAVARGRVVASLRDVRLVAAAAASGALYLAIQYAVAVTHEPSWERWQQLARRFVAQRSRHAWPGDALDASAFLDRLAKLWHQHFAFQHDLLGDRTRWDHLWTLPEAHVAWLVLLPLAAFGAWQAWRSRDRASGVFAAVLVPTYAVALTVGFPEGRYLLTATPALAWFTLKGLVAISGGVRPAVLGAALAAMSLNSFVLVRGEYNDHVSNRWKRMAGLREAVALVRREHGAEYGTSRDVHLHWPGLRFDDLLYAQMLWNMRMVPFPEVANLAAVAAGETLFAAVEVVDGSDQAIRLWKARGFHQSGEVVDGPSGRRFVILYSPP